MKESRNVEVQDCFFNLRYPFWHDEHIKIMGSELTELCRAALWYSRNIEIADTRFHGIKALRECSQIKMHGCDIVSPEFGWSVHQMEMDDSTVESEYFMMRSDFLTFRNVALKGKYSFQYIENSFFENCKIIGTQPLCYCKGLKLVDCEMINTDLCFEKSEVEATIKISVDSIKNPLSGHIHVPCVGTIIRDDKESKGNAGDSCNAGMYYVGVCR